MNYFVNHYGESAQLEKLKEEAIELAHAIQRYQSGKGSIDEVKDEMADCDNLIGQFSEHWSDGSIFMLVRKKQDRQMERIRNENNRNNIP